MIKKRIKKHYLGDGLLTHVFWGVFLSCFYPVLVMFFTSEGQKFGQYAAYSLEVLSKTSIQETLNEGVPPLPFLLPYNI